MFKDDCIQDHSHVLVNNIGSVYSTGIGSGSASHQLCAGNGAQQYSLGISNVRNARAEATTHGKQKGIKYIIKVL